MNTIAAKTISTTIAAATALFCADPCQAAATALPWDYTLFALQDIFISYIAAAAIGLAISGAIVLYALGGCDEQAGRLLGSALGGGIALGIVYLLNYILP